MADPVKSSSSSPAQVSTPVPAANSQKQNEKNARPTLEEQLQELFRSTTLVRREFLVDGTRVGVLFNPPSAIGQQQTTSNFTVAPVVLVTENTMNNALMERFGRAAGALFEPVVAFSNETVSKTEGKTFNIFKAFGFHTN